jgi:hypothetical protein
MRTLAPLIARIALAVHLLLTAAWWWLTPSGFPLSSPHFYVNSILPPLVLALLIVALIARTCRRTDLAAALLLPLPMLWLAAAVSGRIVFPISLRWLFLLPIAAAALWAWALLAESPRPRIRLALIIALFVAAAVGAWLPFSQRGQHPSTHSLGPTLAEADPTQLTPARLSRIAPGVIVQSDGALMLQRGRYMLYVQPILTFVSVSPDRCWTLLAPRSLRRPPPRELLGHLSADTGAHLRFNDASLRVEASGNVIDIDANTHLPLDVYSHLNTWCEIELAGHRKLQLVFSPAPESPIDVTYMQAPFGAPGRLAFLDPSDQLRIVEASNAEKGPFRTLAAGPLDRGDPLSIIVLDEGTPLWHITFDDFSAQASTDLSPTAGYGLPQNAIEFSRASDGPSSPASLFLTLAATSTGRGYHSVGHAAGTYRNRMKIEWLGPGE